MKIQSGETLLMVGDSVTDFGRARPIGEGRNDNMGTGYPALVKAFIRSSYPERMIRVINMGVSGDTSRDLYARWQTDVLDLHPDYLTILIGINDVWRQFDQPEMVETHVSISEYESNLDTLISRTLPTLKGLILLTPYYMEPNPTDTMRACMDKYGAVIKSLGAKYSVPVIDLQSHFNALFTHVHSTSIAWDRIHPNLTGHMMIAREILKLLDFEK